jgi:hypothetical protein
MFEMHVSAGTLRIKISLENSKKKMAHQLLVQSKFSKKKNKGQICAHGLGHLRVRAGEGLRKAACCEQRTECGPVPPGEEEEAN